MSEEFNLSEKEMNIFEPTDGSTWFEKKDVKEFIRRRDELDMDLRKGRINWFEYVELIGLNMLIRGLSWQGIS